MRCRACNEGLSPFEATRKYAESGAFIDLCNKCFKPVAHLIKADIRPDLFDAKEDVKDEIPPAKKQEPDDDEWLQS